MHVALAQLNPLVGDLQGNADRILAAVREAEAQAADLVLTPELSLWGYPPRDLLLQPARIAEQQRILQQLVNQLTSSITLLVGVALATDESPPKQPRFRGLNFQITIMYFGVFFPVCS